MKFKIRHEKMSLVLALIAAFLLLDAIVVYCIMHDQTLGLLCALILMCIDIFLFILAQTVRTEIVISDDMITVRHLFRKTKIAVNKISDLRIERYNRMRRRFYREQRMRMTIVNCSGKKTVLNDTAMVSYGSSGLLSQARDALPDEDVTLYKVYRIIQDMLR